MAQIKEKYPENIQHFYYKGKIIILAIYDILENKIIKTDEDIDNCMDKIRLIPHLEKLDEKLNNKIDTDKLNLLKYLNERKEIGEIFLDKIIYCDEEKINKRYQHWIESNSKLSTFNWM